MMDSDLMVILGFMFYMTKAVGAVLICSLALVYIRERFIGD
jgi:hypothetical protein